MEIPKAPAPEKALDQIKKLFALASSPNEHEAAAAAAMAARLMEKHAITAAMLDVPAADAPRVEDDPLDVQPRSTTWRLRLAMAVAMAHGCYILVRGFQGEASRNLHLVGRADDTATARYVFAYLARAVEQLAKAQAGRGATWLNNYKLGVVDSIGLRLKAGQDAARREARAAAASDLATGAATERAIARVDARSEDAKTAAMKSSPEAKLHTPRPGAFDADARQRGRLDGRTVDLGQQTAGGLGAPASGALPGR